MNDQAGGQPGSQTTDTITQELTRLYDQLGNTNWNEALIGLLSKVLIPAILGILALLAAYFVAKLFSKRVTTVLCSKIDETLGRFIGKTVFYGILITAGTMVLPKLGIQVSGIMAILATAGFAIGLAFQGTLSNFSAGILLLVFRPFKVGDSVVVAGVSGKVNEIEIFTTTLDTSDNRRLILPNSSIAGTTIENISFHAHRRVDVNVWVEYASSLDATRQALTECVQLMSAWIVPGEGRGYQIMLNNLGTHAVEWSIRIWVDRDCFAAAREALIGNVKVVFDRYHIGIPHLQTQVSHAATRPIDQQPKPAASPPAIAIPGVHANHERSVPLRPRVRGEGQRR